MRIKFSNFEQFRMILLYILFNSLFDNNCSIRKFWKFFFARLLIQFIHSFDWTTKFDKFEHKRKILIESIIFYALTWKKRSKCLILYIDLCLCAFYAFWLICNLSNCLIFHWSTTISNVAKYFEKNSLSICLWMIENKIKMNLLSCLLCW